MNHILTWEFYCSLYDSIKEENFEKAVTKAEAAVRSVIGAIRWQSITEKTFGYEQLQICICEVMNQQAVNEAKGIGTGVTSVSNDGYSETYAGGTAADTSESLKSIIRNCLSGTGLVGAY